MKIFPRFILLLLFFGVSAAKADPQVISFQTTQKNWDGSILITGPTSITFSVGISRAPSGNTYESVLMNLYFVYVGSTEVSLLQTPIGTNDFNGGSSVSKSYTFTIPAGSVGGSVRLRYTYTSSQGIAMGPIELTTVYPTVAVVPPPPPPPPATPAPTYNGYRDGQIIKCTWTPGKPIFVCIEGYWRHIEAVETLIGIFSGYSMDSQGYPPFDNWGIGTVVGTPIPNSCELLVNNAEGGRVYWREGTIVRWITSMDVKRKYHFNWNSLRYVSNLNGYTKGPDLY